MPTKNAITVRLSDVDLEHLDEFQAHIGATTRSEAMQMAVRLSWAAMNKRKKAER